MSKKIYILLGLVVGSLIWMGCSKGKTGTQGMLERVGAAVTAAVTLAHLDTKPLQYEFEYDGRAYFSLACDQVTAKAISKAIPQKDEKGRAFQYEFEYDGSVYISYPEA